MLTQTRFGSRNSAHSEPMEEHIKCDLLTVSCGSSPCFFFVWNAGFVWFVLATDSGGDSFLDDVPYLEWDLHYTLSLSLPRTTTRTRPVTRFDLLLLLLMGHPLPPWHNDDSCTTTRTTTQRDKKHGTTTTGRRRRRLLLLLLGPCYSSWSFGDSRRLLPGTTSCGVGPRPRI